ncbi:protein-glutamate methylesterase/protein-glutamine glutaminase [Desulfoluna spongiiphila]|uniref:Protein-glutamate methylesterase/protein-glutamine glutaminase n=1 Tax=Desulfoluna spongiiphila TaxID=419481 RepID=A0A1G5F559_9BACT|nr:chemotaxis response regulator protein-glutamate methylesterase [Desulfoluna spongiiphila]SCY34347.1 two-component system, chemotaxis family, response regulator CheB [Desulfoluna spongiiphila]
MKKKVRVLVVDDSALVRQTLSGILESDDDIEVMATASDPYDAARKMREEVPDVITLDVEMPKMDGITFLEKLMAQHPIPVVLCSSLAAEESATALKALELGAVEIIRKPTLGTKAFLAESRIQICDAVKSAALSHVKKKPSLRSVEPKLSADAVLVKSTRAMLETTEKVVVIGASTGGTEALRIFLEQLPADAPGMVIVQHMPEHFTKAFSKRLDTLCRVSVKEAENKDPVARGQVLIAPGNMHLLLKRSGARYHVEVKTGPLVSRHRPSVDVLFRSAARYAGKNAVGVLMTGMGDDGAKGLLEMKQAGAATIAQDKASCVVFGMPNEAIKLGGVDRVVSLEQISGVVLGCCGETHHV